MTALTLGVDPGKSGAFALLAPDGRIVHIEDAPALAGAALGAWLATLIADFSPDTVGTAYVERVNYMPGQRGVWTFAEGYGATLGALGALGIPVVTVPPGTWKKAAGLTNKDKGASRQLAAELWPTEAHQFARVKDDGRAEACLVARHGQKDNR